MRNPITLVGIALIKLLTHSTEGKECLLAIHRAGDTFGELCLAG